MGVSTRTFDSPLFASPSTTTYRAFARQSAPGSGNYSAWLSGGFPDYQSFFGVTGDSIPVGSRLLGFTAGDFQLTPAQPEFLLSRLRDSYPIQGASINVAGKTSAWNVFGGRSRYALEVPGREPVRSSLYGGEYLGHWKRFAVGGGLTLVGEPAYADPTVERSTQAIFNGRVARKISPRLGVFGEGYYGVEAGGGFRTGVSYRFQRGDVAASLYGFSDDLPYVYPLYRPGEKGIELRGSVSPTGLSRLWGTLYYADDDVIRQRAELRGTIGYGIRFGSHLPILQFSYTHDDVVYDSFSQTDRSYLADRIVASVSHQRTNEFLTFAAEHQFSSHATTLDRTQAQLTYRKLVGLRSFVDGSAVVQRDEADNLGVTVESSMERPLYRALYYIVGLGAAYVDRLKGRSGEGVLRLGLSRRIARSGWYARGEVRIPFGIGIQESHLNRQFLALDVGTRFDWADLGELRQHLPGGNGIKRTATLEGTITMDGRGQGGITILVDGEPRAVSAPDGTYRIRGVATGAVMVTVDLRSLAPGYEVTDGGARLLTTVAKGVSRADFEVSRFSSLQGAVVLCNGDRLDGVGGLEVILSSETFRRVVHTSSIGSFQFDQIPPGHYALTFGPELDERLDGDPRPRLRVDLEEDIYGYILGAGCPPGSQREHPRITPIVEP